MSLQLLCLLMQSYPSMIFCLENERHGLEDGDLVEIAEVQGMAALNGKKYTVKGAVSTMQ